jgi:membrane protease YdiL (CAAX protease family)
MRGVSKRRSAVPYAGPAVVAAVMLFAVWMAATYLLEGLRLTLQRPDAITDRLVYALVANLVIGVLGSVLVLWIFAKAGTVDIRRAGFNPWRYSLIAVLAGAVLGFVLYLAQGGWLLEPMVLVNVYAQVLVVSMAEVLVCWCVLGSLVEASLLHRNRWLAVLVATVVSSVLFGLYHFAHSPPFNTWELALLLTLIGLVTSIFFFVSRSVYGTIAFHNSLAIYGVIDTLEASGSLDVFREPVVPLLVMAAAAVLVLIGGHLLLVARTRPGHG